MNTQLHELNGNHRCELCGAELKAPDKNNQTADVDLVREYILKYYE